MKLSERAVERLQRFRMRIRHKIVDQYYARTPLGNDGHFMVPWGAHHEGSRTLWEAQTTDYLSYFYYKLNGWESRSLYLALDGERVISYVRKASPGIVPRPRTDYEVLARRKILAGDVFCVVVGTLKEYDNFHDIPDIVGGVPSFIRCEPGAKCVVVSTTDQPFDSGYSVAHTLHERYNGRRMEAPLRPDFNYPYFMRSNSQYNISVNCRVVFLPIGNIFFLVAKIDIEEGEEVVIENTSMCMTNVVVREEHVYLDYRAFFQKWINGPDKMYFKEHAGRDMAFERARGIEIGFGRFYGTDTLTILSPMPSSVELENLEEVEEDSN